MQSTTTKSWLDFAFNKQLLQAIDAAGYTQPTEVQQKCIPLILGGQEVIGIAQTGTGKTAAYALPLIMKVRYAQGTDPRALVLAPTKELTVQLAQHIRTLAQFTDLRIVPLYGGVGPKTQIETLQKGVDILVATPGRLMELYLAKHVVTKQLKTLVLDEADRMMDMGFMPQLRRIFEIIPPKRQNLLFSATFSDKVERLSQEFLEFPVKIEVTPPATTAKQVAQLVYEVPNLKTKIHFLEHLLSDRAAFARVMVFTRTKEAADQVTHYLERKGLGPVRVIHSNKGQNSRINAMNEFREGQLRVLVSTDVSARGIDVVQVSHVINFDVPVMYDDYVHRIGRTGRAFETGTAITMVTPAEVYHLKKIEDLIRQKLPLKKLPAAVAVAETLADEQQEMAREIDRQRQREDPDYQGAFHERKRK
ncbi:MAG: DEAD/DEAH box helicase [Cyclobacteriaceae bacterium]|jgi:ATP-dependent RNA helicase RhlE|nr:DEAD/DEAH box helicase [Cyclobacteriaceae bacterium]